MKQTVLIVPGLRGSGPAHWQTLWLAKHPEYVRVLQREWAVARLDNWAAAIDAAIVAAGGGVFVVAHGFGCLATLRRLRERCADVLGALLVAPRDPAHFGLELEEFAFPTTLVGSRNDPDLAFLDARRMARRLGSRFVDAAEAGHIDAGSGYGPWLRGERLLASLIARAQARERELQVALALVA